MSVGNNVQSRNKTPLAGVSLESGSILDVTRLSDAHLMSAADALTELGVDADIGLDDSEGAKRRIQFGENWLPRQESQSLMSILVDQLRGVIVWLLAAAAILSFAVGDFPEGIAIACVLLINTMIGFFTSLRAMRSMEALYKLADVRARVMRNGKLTSLSARELVPGDIISMQAGDVVPADLRLLEVEDARIDESTLTGESAPIQKSTASVAANTLVADRTCMAYKGSALVRGECQALVIATGVDTELGRISELAHGATGQAFPLEKRLDRLGGRLVWLAVGLSILVGIIGITGGRGAVEMIETAIALAVAAVPEGLPVVATLALARGMLRMAKRNTLIARLSAVETLGSTTIILTDKTGTLTENRMTVTRILLPDDDVGVDDIHLLDVKDNTNLRLTLEVGVLCNSASIADVANDTGERSTGSPLEIALLSVGRRAGLSKEALSREYPEVRRYAFDATHKAMATIGRSKEGFRFAVKGAPEQILERSTRVQTPDGPKKLSQAHQKEWSERLEMSASQGFRLLGLAYKDSDDENETPFEELVLLGFVCFLDPLRPDVPDAIANCLTAGVGVVMMTGDHIATASEIARQAGLGTDGNVVAFSEHDLTGFNPDTVDDKSTEALLDADVFARVTPETKLKLVRFYQNAGHVVAMTGDGVNDAPALKQADIGIAMGQRGTQVARESAAMVLKDDAFTSIVAAMHQGRVIYSNIRRFVTYLMSCNFSEILVVGLAIVAGLPAPLTPLQILFLNLVTDVFPAFALGLGEGSSDVMSKKPRDPEEPILDRRRWIEICVYGAMITIATLGVFAFCLFYFEESGGDCMTAAFLTLALAQLWHVFNMHGVEEEDIRNSITNNRFVWAALVMCIVLTIVVFLVPQLSYVLKLTIPKAEVLVLVVGASFFPLAAGKVWFIIRRSIRSEQGHKRH